MAAYPIEISGVLYDKKNKTAQNVTIIGIAGNPNLQVGGGPIIPDQPLPPLDLGIWEDPGGYNPDHPSEPVPPDQPPATDQPPVKLKAQWDEENGWTVVIVAQPPAGAEVPTPSKKR